MEAIIFSASYSAIAFLAFMLLRYFDNRLTISFGFLVAARTSVTHTSTLTGSIRKTSGCTYCTSWRTTTTPSA